MIASIKFGTARLSIEPLLIEDWDFIFTLLNTEGWIKFIGNRNINSKEDAIAYIQKIISNPDYRYYVFKLKETRNSIGLVTLIKRDYLDYCDIGFAILPEYEKRGYSFEVSRKFMTVLKDSGLYSKVVAITVPENFKSIALLEKLGLVYEKEIEEDSEIFSVYHKAL